MSKYCNFLIHSYTATYMKYADKNMFKVEITKVIDTKAHCFDQNIYKNFFYKQLHRKFHL